MFVTGGNGKALHERRGAFAFLLGKSILVFKMVICSKAGRELTTKGKYHKREGDNPHWPINILSWKARKSPQRPPRGHSL